MKNKSKNLLYNPGEYWKKEFKYNFDKEFETYEFVCGELNKKQQEKVSNERRFSSYSAWEEYVKGLYEDKDSNKLKEFWHYLNHRNRVDTAFRGAFYSIILTIIGTQLFSLLFSKLMELQPPKSNIQGLVLKEALIVIGFNLFLYLLIFVIIEIAIIYSICKISKGIFTAEYRKAFYNDYMKIIKGIIDKKEKIRKIQVIKVNYKISRIRCKT